MSEKISNTSQQETIFQKEITTRVNFRTALVEIDEWNIWATFEDGVKNQFYLPYINTPEYMAIVAEYGYGDDYRRYAFEHELAHHFLADNLGFRYSWAVHDGAAFNGRLEPADWPNHIAWEENLVNAFQGFCQAGRRDKWGVLHCVLPEKKLAVKKSEFKELCTKVLDKKRHVFYNAETGHTGLIKVKNSS